MSVSPTDDYESTCLSPMPGSNFAFRLWAPKARHFPLLLQFRLDTLVTADAQGTTGCDGLHSWRRILLRDRGQLLVGTTVPSGQGHRAGYVQLPLGGARSVNIFTRLGFPGAI
jgi:hypothetical protein